MKTALVLRHMIYEDLGSLEPSLVEHGFRVVYIDPATESLHEIQPVGPELVIVLGGPFSVGDEADHPWLKTEYMWLRSRLELDLPTLGICLGAQLMAKAWGARVYAAPAKEIGWYSLALTPLGAAGPVRHFDQSCGPVLQWHGETFDLPAKSKLLTSTADCVHQAFQIGRHGLALQFHPEVTAAGLEPWLADQGNDLEDAAITAAELRKQSALHAPVLAHNAKIFLHEWLVQVALAKTSNGLQTDDLRSHLGARPERSPYASVQDNNL